MLKVTRLDKSQLWVNAEIIDFVEATPDTVISLISDKKIVVKEPAEAEVDAIKEYRRLMGFNLPMIIENGE
jgi:flagellar protein FlbD